MRESKQKQIGELLFTVTQVPATRGSRIANKLARTVLPALARAAKGLDGLDTSKGFANAKLDLGKLLANLGDGLELFFASMPVEEYEKLWRELFEFVQVTSVETGKTAALLPVMDEILAGKQLTFLKLLVFALEVNFQDFFQELAGLPQMGTAASGLLSKISGTSETSGFAGVSS